MKLSTQLFTLALAGFAALFSGCSDKDEPELFSIGNSEFTVESAAGSQTKATFDVGTEWTAAPDADSEWLTVSPDSGKARLEATITITAGENTATEPRTGHVIISYGTNTYTLTVMQKRKEVMALQGNKQAFVGKGGGNVSFFLNTNVDAPVVEIPDDARSWLSSVETKTPGELEFSVKPNSGGFRKASVKIGNASGTVSIIALVGQTDTDNTDWENYYYTTGSDLEDLVPADAQKLILFGTPGKEDFKYMCDKLIKLASLDLSHTTITEIPDNAFYNESLYKNYFTEIVFPATLTRIGDKAFYECYSLGEGFSFPAGLEEIGDEAFFGCLGLKGTLALPATLRIIGKEAFASCSGISGDLVIPGSVTSIGSKAFEDCTGFEKQRLIISEGITEIGDYAFARSGFAMDTPQGFSSLVLPSTLKKIGSSAFYACTGLTQLHLPEGLTDIGSWAFSYCDGLTQLTLPSSLLNIGSLAFNQCHGLKGRLILPDGLLSIGSSAFMSCSGFTGNLVIPNSVVSLEYQAFWGTGFDGTLTLSKNLKTVSWNAFCKTKLTGNLIIPEGVTTIESSAFSGASFTGKLVVPASVTEVGNAFVSGCNGLTEIYWYPDEPISLQDYNHATVWSSTNPDKKLYVPAGSVEKYKAQEGWSQAFNDGANIFPIPQP